MADDFRTVPSRSPDPYFHYEQESSPKQAKGASSKLPVPPQLGELKPQSEKRGKIASSHRFEKFISGMWGVVQQVIDSTRQPNETKSPVNPPMMTQRIYVEKCFKSFTDHFKELYDNISNRSSS